MPSSIQYIDLPIPTRGVIANRSRREIGMEALCDSNNFVYLNGEFRVRDGVGERNAQLPSAQPIMGIVQYDHADELRRIVVATRTNVYYLASSSSWTDITPDGGLSGDATGLAQFRVFRKGTPGTNYLILCNGLDSPIVWDGDAVTPSEFIAVGGSAPVSQCMMVLGGRLILGGVYGTGGFGIDWSSLNDYDSGWGTNTVLLRDTPGKIVAMQEMGNHRGIVYKEDAIYACIQQSGVVAFSFQLKRAGISGPVSRLSVVPLPSGAHIYLSKDGGVYLFDGEVVQSVGSHVMEWVRNKWNPDNYEMSYGFYDTERKLVWFVFPAQGSETMSEAICINPDDMTLWPQSFASLSMTAGLRVYEDLTARIGDIDDTIGSFDDSFTLGSVYHERPGVVFGSSEGQMYVQDQETDAGSYIQAHFETGVTSAGNNVLWKTLHEIEHMFVRTSSPQYVSISIGTTDYNDEVDWTTHGKATTEGVDLYTGGPWRTGHRLTARFFAMRMSCNSTAGVSWLGSSAAISPRGPR